MTEKQLMNVAVVETIKHSPNILDELSSYDWHFSKAYIKRHRYCLKCGKKIYSANFKCCYCKTKENMEDERITEPRLGYNCVDIQELLRPLYEKLLRRRKW